MERRKGRDIISNEFLRKNGTWLLSCVLLCLFHDLYFLFLLPQVKRADLTYLDVMIAVCLFMVTAVRYGRYRAAEKEKQEQFDLKVFHAIAVFMFMVFVLASDSVLFMKLYNDAFNEKERYVVLKKPGLDSATLGRVIASELRAAYAYPFVTMVISFYFSAHALEKLMTAGLKMINIVSVLIILAFFILFYLLSVALYQKNAGYE